MTDTPETIPYNKRPKSPETKLKMSLASKGKPKSKNHRKNMSVARLAYLKRIKNV